MVSGRKTFIAHWKEFNGGCYYYRSLSIGIRIFRLKFTVEPNEWVSNNTFPEIAENYPFNSASNLFLPSDTFHCFLPKNLTFPFGNNQFREATSQLELIKNKIKFFIRIKTASLNKPRQQRTRRLAPVIHWKNHQTLLRFFLQMKFSRWFTFPDNLFDSLHEIRSVTTISSPIKCCTQAPARHR